MKYLLNWGLASVWWISCVVALHVPLFSMEGVLPAFVQVVLHGQDILLLLSAAFLSFFLVRKRAYVAYGEALTRHSLVLWAILFLFILSFWALHPVLHWITIIRLCLLGYVGTVVAHIFPNFWKNVGRVFLAYVVLQGLIAWLQVVFGHDMGLRYLGEPMLGTDMYNVAKIHIWGLDILRGYGFFVHPNLLAAHSAVGLALVAYLYKDSYQRYFWSLLLIATGIASFSKAFFLLIVIFLLLISVRDHRWKPFAGRVAFFTAVLLLCSPFIWGWGFVWERWLQVEAAIRALFLFPWGGGFGSAVELQDRASAFLLAPWEVQPVHNVFLLAGLEWSLLGLFLVVLLFWKGLNSVRFVPREYRFTALGLLLTFFLFGMVDHFWFTLREGQLLLVYILVWLSVLFGVRQTSRSMQREVTETLK